MVVVQKRKEKFTERRRISTEGQLHNTGNPPFLIDSNLTLFPFVQLPLQDFRFDCSLLKFPPNEIYEKEFFEVHNDIYDRLDTSISSNKINNQHSLNFDETTFEKRVFEDSNSFFLLREILIIFNSIEIYHQQLSQSYNFCVALFWYV
jgi:hypothetical protein